MIFKGGISKKDTSQLWFDRNINLTELIYSATV